MLRIRDHVARPAAEGLNGRAEELAILLQCLEPGGPHVVHLHGVAGVGKSSLLEPFAAEASGRGVMTARLDCRGVEPTERGFLHELETEVWGYDYHGGSNVVDAVVRSLRKKLGDRSSCIETVHGAGYRLRG
jgi:hypothetical protein